jgi:rhodanese-related sulfurtransferase
MIKLYPLQAYRFLGAQKDALLIDVRSENEFMLVGHAQKAIHIAWYLETGPETNTAFLGQLLDVAGSRNRPLIFICRNGERSQEAATFAESNGFTQIFNVIHGFEGDRDENNRRSAMNGWRYEGLPWEQC